jgi:hypothetical protein
MSFISGPYRWTFTPETGIRLPLGITEDAPSLRYSQNGIPINADAYGGNPIDAIYTGMTAFIGFVFQEWDETGVQHLLSTPGGVMGQLGSLGCPFIDKQAGVLIGERLPFADCAEPEIFIAYRASMAPNQEIELSFGGSRLRQVPIVLQLYPYARTVGTNPNETVHVFELLDALPVPNPLKSHATSLANYISGL